MEGARISSPVDNHVLIPARTCPLAVHASQARRVASLAVGVPQASSPRMGSVCSQLTATATSSLEPWVSSASLPLISATRFRQQPWSSASFCLVLHLYPWGPGPGYRLGTGSPAFPTPWASPGYRVCISFLQDVGNVGRGSRTQECWMGTKVRLLCCLASLLLLWLQESLRTGAGQ